ncbi:nucleoid-associated protein [Mycolicibacterium sp. P9-64]|uniref:nucleoid-associated protein n=1 Tax=Mycolicibacterium sp. P9-64 TaxID=2024612 RepID=UPI001F5BFFF4|nr:nucleoid-associated protein [Mycolicibacterium sp. P9-64]
MKVTRWVIHEIPKAIRDRDNVRPKLSEIVSPYDAEVARFFERKISESLSKSKHAIQPADDERRVPILIAEQLADPKDGLLDASTSLAGHLFAAQSGAMSPGLLVVMEGTYRSAAPFLAVLKLEKEEGARAATTEIDGRSTFSVEYMKDLFLTGRTRVFKVSVFMVGDADPPKLRGWISDPQSRGIAVADFFLDVFLGCALVDDPRITTRQFHTEAESFINNRVADPATKMRYETALVAELQGNSTEINIRSFAARHLDLHDRAPFEKAVTTAGVARSFVKDTSQTKLARVQYEFMQGVKVSYPADTPDDVVSVSGRADGRTELQVVDNLKKLNSRG